MTTILIDIQAEQTAEIITGYLTGEGLGVVRGGGGRPAEADPALWAGWIAGQGADIALLDFVSEDAFSVKVMQTAMGKDPCPQFMFVIPEDPDPAQMMMAMNEGAAAFLTPSFPRAALMNYVNRAIQRKKEDQVRAEEMARYRGLMESEKRCALEQAETMARLQDTLKRSWRLIGHLLAAPKRKSGATVLLASDSAYQLDVFRKVLREHGFQVVTAGDGLSALETARTEKPRIIVSDLEMPGLNGIELCRAVKNDESLGPNHFIVCTASRNKIDDVLKPENKVDDCFLKPSQPEEFLEFTGRVGFGLLI